MSGKTPAPILVIENWHFPQDGELPHISNTNPDEYIGYFESELGDQAIFVYNRKTKLGMLRMGDAEWSNVWPVEDGKVKVTLGPEEEAWLGACWRAATGATNTMYRDAASRLKATGNLAA